MMVTMVAVIAMPRIVVPWATIIAVVSIRPVVSIGVIAVSIRIIAIPITRITESDSN
jgi:hypothetical protein